MEEVLLWFAGPQKEELYSTANNTTQSLFLWKNRLLSVCFTSILCYFSIVADLIFSQRVLNRFLHAVEICSQDDIQILSTTRGENDFLARQDCSSDIWLHLKCLVTVTNFFDWGIICQWFSTESSRSGAAFMTNSVKQHALHSTFYFGHAKGWGVYFLSHEKTSDILDNSSQVLKLYHNVYLLKETLFCYVMSSFLCHLLLKRKLDHTYSIFWV